MAQLLPPEITDESVKNAKICLGKIKGKEFLTWQPPFEVLPVGKITSESRRYEKVFVNVSVVRVFYISYF